MQGSRARGLQKKRGRVRLVQLVQPHAYAEGGDREGDRRREEKATRACLLAQALS